MTAFSRGSRLFFYDGEGLRRKISIWPRLASMRKELGCWREALNSNKVYKVHRKKWQIEKG